MRELRTVKIEGTKIIIPLNLWNATKEAFYKMKEDEKEVWLYTNDVGYDEKLCSYCEDIDVYSYEELKKIKEELKIDFDLMHNVNLADYMLALMDRYMNNRETKKAIEIGTKALEITQDSFEKNEIWFACVLTDNLSKLASLYVHIDQIEEGIKLAKMSIDFLEPSYKEYPESWKDQYLRPILTVALGYYKMKDFDNAVKFFKLYFDINDFEYIDSVEDINIFIYNFIKYIQSLQQNQSKQEIDSGFKMAKKQIEKFKIKFGKSYNKQIAIMQEDYKNDMKMNFDILTKEKYEIFVEIFTK